MDGRGGRKLSRRTLVGGVGAAVGVAATGVVPWATASGSEPRRLAAGIGAAGPYLPSQDRFLRIGPSQFTPVDYAAAVAAGLIINPDGGLATTNSSAVTVTAPILLPHGILVKEIVGLSGTNAGIVGPLWFFTSFPPTTRISSGQAGLFGPAHMAGTVIDGQRSYAVSVDVDNATPNYGAIVTYAPLVGFVSVIPGRILNTRDNKEPKLGDGEERTVRADVLGGSTAVFNLTVTETEGAGYVACFPPIVLWPGNSNINWSGPGLQIANTTVCETGDDGSFKIRGGAAPTHVIIDLLGYMGS
jgi:hypothetical protein